MAIIWRLWYFWQIENIRKLIIALNYYYKRFKIFNQEIRLKESGKKSAGSYYFIAQKNFNISKATISEDLIILANNGILSRYGKTGKGTKYVLRRLKDAKMEMGSQRGNKGAPMGQKGQ